MLFSIIVPIYKVEAYLDKCIKSLINQTYSDIEIILVDDESPDSCPTMCEEYKRVDDRIKVIHKKNGGLSDARNAGLSVASGDYIIFVDADDYIDINTCEMFSKYTKLDCDIIIGDAIVEGGETDLSHIKNNKIMTGSKYLLAAYENGKAPMAAWLNVYKKNFLITNKLRFKYGILHEDEEFTPRALLKAQKLICSGVDFYHYVIRANSITTKKDKRKNATDLYQTLCSLEKLYLTIDNEDLKNYLLDSLSVKYMHIFQIGQLYKYGNQYTKKQFVKRNAKCKRTKIKSKLYYLSPKAYYLINHFVKKFHQKNK